MKTNATCSALLVLSLSTSSVNYATASAKPVSICLARPAQLVMAIANTPTSTVKIAAQHATMASSETP